MIGIELVVTDAIAQWRPQKLITILTYPLNACTDQQKTINFGATAWRLQIVAVNTTMTKDAWCKCLLPLAKIPKRSLFTVSTFTKNRRYNEPTDH